MFLLGGRPGEEMGRGWGIMHCYGTMYVDKNG